MTDFADSAAAMRARLEAYDSNRRPRRRADERARRDATPYGDRRAADRARVAEIRRRQPGDPRGTLSEPLPMGPGISPNSRWSGARG